ncbi:hypothetical protein SAMN03159307_05704 [Pseudomonas sp. NFACC46-3]|nr:hypothetical protein SAMN03159307_05704 [Pseudomonas sp. NFACC46-3]
MGLGQVHRWWLVYRYREQARSHRFSRCLVHWCQEIHLLGWRTAGRSCGEGACSRWAAQRPLELASAVGQVDCGQSGWDCFAVQREQAPSPRGWWWLGIFLLCEHARDGARSGTSMVAGVPLSRASSLPQVFQCLVYWCWACTCLADAPPAALVARELAPVGLRSGPWSWPARWVRWIAVNRVGAASRSELFRQHAFVASGALIKGESWRAKACK